MKKTKRLTALFLTLTFILSTVLSAYATTVTSPSATTVTVDAATDDEGNTYTIVNITAGDDHLDEDSDAYQEAVEVGGYVYIEETDEEPDIADDQDIAASVEEKVQELVETLAEEGVSLVNESTGETVTAKNVTIAATVEINWYDLGIDYDTAKDTVIKWPIKVRFNVPGVTKYNFVGAMHKPTGGDWQFERAEFVSDGYVDVWLYSFSPVSFLVVSTEDTTTQITTDNTQSTVSPSGGTNNQTGDISLVVPIVLLVVAAVAIVVIVVMGKKKETE